MRHQQVISNYLLSLVKAAELSNPELLAQQLAILINGATVIAMMQDSSEPAIQAKQAAAMLIAGS